MVIFGSSDLPIQLLEKIIGALKFMLSGSQRIWNRETCTLSARSDGPLEPLKSLRAWICTVEYEAGGGNTSDAPIQLERIRREGEDVGIW